jgi:hypothetical protein
MRSVTQPQRHWRSRSPSPWRCASNSTRRASSALSTIYAQNTIGQTTTRQNIHQLGAGYHLGGHEHDRPHRQPDCEVLLHAPSTLSRIVVRRKRSYIWPEDRRFADAETQKRRQRPQALKEPSP